jgi:sirohydrochlorin cobaltochelatase
VTQSAPPAARHVSADDWLRDLPCRIGQILIARSADGGFALCHRDDAERADLGVYRDAEAAVALAQYDDAGAYRPLKTAPNLRHGWSLQLADAASVRVALDLFYPGRLPAYAAWRRGNLETTPLRATLNRQTGMYRVAAKITDEQANRLIANFCRSDVGCLRTIAWRRDANDTTPSTLLPPEKYDPAHDQTGRAEETVPLLCQEPCNLLVAAARNVVKGDAG